MQRTTQALAQPPWLYNAEGEVRRVGVELELGGLELDEVAACVGGFLGAAVQERGRYERAIAGDPAGEWIVEVDFDLLKRLGRQDRTESPSDSLSQTAETLLARAAEEALAWTAEAVVPVEVVSPPLPLSRLGEVEGLIVALRDAGAKGSSDSLLNAFGMQFNPELPSADPKLIASCLKAFLCLYDWLLARADVDITRRVLSFADPFPLTYLRQVIATDYWPDRATLIDDYLAENPTRSRALDLLPLFVHLDEDRVRRVVADELVKGRPTFHYRLPDCEIHRPDWSLSIAWKDWVAVERLAHGEARLNACCSAYQAFLDKPMERWLGDWKVVLEQDWVGA